MFHICRTIRRHFSLRQVRELCIGQRKYKQEERKERKKGSTDRPSEFALAHLTPILHFKIVVKMFSFGRLKVDHARLLKAPKLKSRHNLYIWPPGVVGGRYSQKNLVGVCGPLPKTLTLFMTKICDFPYPIYDLTKNLVPFL